jgi:hypothetical protein
MPIMWRVIIVKKLVKLLINMQKMRKFKNLIKTSSKGVLESKTRAY